MSNESTTESEWNEVFEEAKQISMKSYELSQRLASMAEKGVSMDTSYPPINIHVLANYAFMHTHNLWIYMQEKIKSSSEE